MLRTIVQEQVSAIMVLPNRISVALANNVDANRLRYPIPKVSIFFEILCIKFKKKKNTHCHCHVSYLTTSNSIFHKIWKAIVLPFWILVGCFFKTRLHFVNASSWEIG